MKSKILAVILSVSLIGGATPVIADTVDNVKTPIMTYDVRPLPEKEYTARPLNPLMRSDLTELTYSSEVEYVYSGIMKRTAKATSQTTNQDGDRQPIDYISAEVKTYKDGIFKEKSKDEQEHASYVGTGIKGYNDSWTQLRGYHVYKHTGFNGHTSETIKNL